MKNFYFIILLFSLQSIVFGQTPTGYPVNGNFETALADDATQPANWFVKGTGSGFLRTDFNVSGVVGTATCFGYFVSEGDYSVDNAFASNKYISTDSELKLINGAEYEIRYWVAINVAQDVNIGVKLETEDELGVSSIYFSEIETYSNSKSFGSSWQEVVKSFTFYDASLAEGTEVNATLTFGFANNLNSIDNTKGVNIRIDEVEIWEVSVPGAEDPDNTLSSISINGTPIDEFDASTTSYFTTLTAGEDYPTITAVANSDVATVQVNPVDENEKTEIVVTAENGNTNTYTVQGTYTFNPSFEEVNDALTDGDKIYPMYWKSNAGSTRLRDYAYGIINGQYFFNQFISDAIDPDNTDNDPFYGGKVLKQSKEEASDFKLVNGESYELSFYVASNRTEDANIAVKVEATPEGRFANILVDEMQVIPFDAANTIKMVTVPFTFRSSSPSLVVGEAYNASVTLGFGLSKATSAVNKNLGIENVIIRKAKGQNAELFGIYLDDVLIEGFESSTKEYTVSLPTNAPNVITVDAKDKDAVVAIDDQESKLVISVTSEDGLTTEEYTVNKVILKSDNANLASISVDGVEIEEFSKDQLTYEVTIAAEADGIVTAEAEHEAATVSITAIDNVHTILVTAEDESTKEYTVTLTEGVPPLSTNANLASIAVDGVEIEEFSKDQLTYEVTIAAEADGIVTAEAEHEAATVSITAIDNVHTILVTAEDESTKEYTVTLTEGVPPLSTNANLASIAVDGVEIEEFSKDQLTYEVVITEEAAGVVTAVVENSNAITSITAVGNVNTILVTAEDGVTTKEYTVTLTVEVPKSTNANLTSISVDGVAIEGFSVDKLMYDVTIASGANGEVTAIAEDDKANVSITAVGNVHTILVTAEDGVTTKEYTVTLTVEVPKSTNANLTSISVDGVALEEFDVNQLIYSVGVEYDANGIVTALAEDEKALVSISEINNVHTILVTAEDKVTTKEYQVTVTFSERIPSSNAFLSSLKIDGVEVDNFDPESYAYNVTMSSNADVTALPQDENALVTIYSDGTTTVITVTAENGITVKNYILISTQDITTSLDQNQFKRMTIYPNPTTDKVNFTKVVEFQIFDVIGNQIFKGRGNSFDLSKYNNGVYLIKTEGHTYKVIKK